MYRSSLPVVLLLLGASLSAALEPPPPRAPFLYSCKDRTSESACTSGSCECVWCTGACEAAPSSRSREFRELIEGAYQGYCTFSVNDCQRRACYESEKKMAWHVLKYTVAGLATIALIGIAVGMPTCFYAQVGLHPFRTAVVAVLALPLILYLALHTDPYAECAERYGPKLR